MKNAIILFSSILLTLHSYSQTMPYYPIPQNGKPQNAITTAVPFLLINPTAQSTAIADIGVVSATPYYASGFTQNPSLLAKNEKDMGFNVSYKPWLRNLVPDIKMMDASFYYSINKKITLGYSFNYFSLGTVSLTDLNGMIIADIKPKEYYHNLRYAQHLNDYLSIGAGLKYVVSNLTNNIPSYGQPTHSGKALAVDLGANYSREIAKKERSFWRYNLGASIVNIGNKIKYTDSGDGDFMPIQLAIGGMLTYNLDINSNVRYCLDVAYQAEKLMVPTPPIYKHQLDSLGNETNAYEVDANGNPVILAGKDPNRGVAAGMFGSFTDAPGGASEEFSEIVHKIAIENRFVFNENLAVAIRTGYLNENKLKGNRKVVTAGAGIRYKFIYLDFATAFFKNLQASTNQMTSAPRILHPDSYALTLGFKYTFKEKVNSAHVE